MDNTSASMGSLSSRRIKADPARVLELSNTMASYSSKLQDLQAQLRSVSTRLDWQVSSKQGIEDRLTRAAGNLANRQERADNFKNSIQTVCDAMTAADESVARQWQGLQYSMNAITRRFEILPQALTVLGYPPPSFMIQDIPPVPVADLTNINSAISL